MNRPTAVAALVVVVALVAAGLARRWLEGRRASRAPEEPNAESQTLEETPSREPAPSAPTLPPPGSRQAAPAVNPVAGTPSSLAQSSAGAGVTKPAARTAKPLPKEPASKWIADYQDAVCACKTRTCVRDLQPRFMTTRVDYDEDRDNDVYTDGAREALRCYFALPEGS
jgi:hypothetical protein